MISVSDPKRMPVLWLNGAQGVGKSTVGFTIFRQLSDAGTKTAFVDLDQVGLCYPAPEDDPENYRVKAAGLAAVWATFREEGARCMVISGIVETDELAKAHTDLIPDARFTMVRLRVAGDKLKSRVNGRGGLVRYSDDMLRVAEDMDRDQVGDLYVDTDGLTPIDTADLVRVAAGDWPGLP